MPSGVHEDKDLKPILELQQCCALDKSALRGLPLQIGFHDS